MWQVISTHAEAYGAIAILLFVALFILYKVNRNVREFVNEEGQELLEKAENVLEEYITEKTGINIDIGK